MKTTFRGIPFSQEEKICADLIGEIIAGYENEGNCTRHSHLSLQLFERCLPQKPPISTESKDRLKQCKLLNLREHIGYEARLLSILLL